MDSLCVETEDVAKVLNDCASSVYNKLKDVEVTEFREKNMDI